MKINTPSKPIVDLKTPAIVFCFLLVTGIFNSAQASMFDDLVNDAKVSFKEAVDSSKEDLKKEAKTVSDDVSSSVKEQVSTTTNDVKDTIKETTDNAISVTVKMFNGNPNRITRLKLEGIVVGGEASSAENTLAQAGYKKVSANPWQFQKGGNMLKFSATNGMISSIELEGAATEVTFIDKERSRIETTLGKACPPTKTKGTWFCNLEGDNQEYYLELKVRRNKYSYLVEGEI